MATSKAAEDKELARIFGKKHASGGDGRGEYSPVDYNELPVVVDDDDGEKGDEENINVILRKYKNVTTSGTPVAEEGVNGPDTLKKAVSVSFSSSSITIIITIRRWGWGGGK